MTDNTNERAMIGAVAVAGLGLIITAASPLDWVLALTLLGMGEARRRKCKADIEQCFTGLIEWGAESIHYASGELSAATGLGDVRAKLISAACDQLPMGEQIARLFAQKSLPDDFISSIERRASLIVGESGDGKTFLLHWRVQRFIQAHPDGEIIICDPDYGSGHGTQKNDWFGLPLDRVVHTEPDAIADAILLTSTKLDERVAAAKDGVKHKPLLLIVDEWTTLVQDWSSNQVESILSKLRKINRKGLKQNIYLTVGTHSLAVSEAMMPQAFIRDWQALFLWSAAQQIDNYNNLGIARYRVTDAVDQISQTPQNVGGKRSAVAYVDKSLSLVGIPHLELTTERVESAADDAQLWADEWRDRLRAELESEGKLSYAAAWKLTGEPGNGRRNDNPRYVALKAVVDALKNPSADNAATAVAAEPQAFDGSDDCADQSSFHPVATTF